MTGELVVGAQKTTARGALAEKTLDRGRGEGEGKAGVEVAEKNRSAVRE
jgi:hypothetical protein